jgi:aspartyl-tRNA(Asn)/glutamyl-tRNA(Gln) amidotransferase subunit A
MYLSDVYTVPLNLAGNPGISVPCGFAGGLPVGLQIIGRPFDEITVLNIAHAFERATAFHGARPPFAVAAEVDAGPSPAP